MNETTKPEIYKGLVGVYADVSAVSKVMPETNSLTYRGYAVQDLAENCSFEEVSYLLASRDPRIPQGCAPDGRHPHRRVLHGDGRP